MSKNIIFCADGTWNGPGEPDSDDKTATPTNVFKTFLNLDGLDDPGTTRLAKEQERSLPGADGTPQQVAKYLHGVGDSDNFLVKALGGTLGAGLITRIVRGYTFVSRNYAPGDKIFLLGFSRGAYTARALAGMISAKGLLDARKLGLTDANKEAAYCLGAAVWFAYRQSALPTEPNLFDRVLNAVLNVPAFLLRPPREDQLVSAPIEAIAVWDTVGSLGIPLYSDRLVRLDVFRFADTKLSTNVKRGRHAIAIDEQRGDFTPTLWDADDRIVQVLFPGAHADVGGGYPLANDESGLSDGAFKWMSDELANLGVRFAASPSCPPKPNSQGTAHRPWAHPPFDKLLPGPRTFSKGLCLSKSVLDRVGGAAVIADPGLQAAAYAPGNLSDYLAGQAAVAGIKVV
jgi:uncharacterized protein (DUF2235 family)